MQLIPLAWDSETGLIRPGLLAPPLACLTWQRPGLPAKICSSLDAPSVLRGWLADPQALFVGANVAYDFGVVAEAFPDLRPAIWRAYEADRVTDVQIRQRLLDIAAGCYGGRFGEKGVFLKYVYTLDALARRLAGMQLQKDAWRTSYAAFVGVPLERWAARAREVQAEARVEAEELARAWARVGHAKMPAAVRERLDGLRSMIESDPSRCTEYPLDDARATLAVFRAQEQHAAFLDDQFRQTRAALWLHCGSAWGLRTDEQGVEVLRRETQAEYEELAAELQEAGLVRPDGSRDTKRAKRLMLDACAREGLRVRRTEGHAEKDPEKSKCVDAEGNKLPPGHEACVEHVTLDSEACHATDDETLIAYAEISEAKKVLANDVEALAGGVVYPVHTRYGLAETGRTTSSRPNIQNLSKRPGIREAFVPRPGRVFAQCDYPTLELYTLAQCCVSWLGQSRLAEALIAGVDPHLLFAAHMLGLTYEQASARKGEPEIKKARQLAKAANFGFPGGMGVAKLVAATRKATLGQEDKAKGRADWEALGLTEARAKQLRDQWFAAWPEMPHYFARVNKLCDTMSGRSVVETLFTRRFRGGATYCATCNNGFQGLAADIAKLAGWLLSRRQYVEPASPLFDSRTVAFVHDEFILETDDGPGAHDCAEALADTMHEAASVYLPDVPMARAKLEPLLMRRWSKKAEPVRGPDGRLVAWGC